MVGERREKRKWEKMVQTECNVHRLRMMLVVELARCIWAFSIFLGREAGSG